MWIDVKERLPRFSSKYRVCLDDGTRMKAHYHPNKRGFTRFFQCLNRVTHWRIETKKERHDWRIIRGQPIDPPGGE